MLERMTNGRVSEWCLEERVFLRRLSLDKELVPIIGLDTVLSTPGNFWSHGIVFLQVMSPCPVTRSFRVEEPIRLFE